MLLGVFTTPIITRYVNPSEYGEFSIFTTYAGIASMVLCLGMDQAMVRYFYESDTKSYKQELLWRCVQLPICVSVIMLCMCILGDYINVFCFEFNDLTLILLCIYVLIQVIYRFSLLLVRLQYKASLYSLLMIIQKGVYIIAAVPMLIFSETEHILVLTGGTILAGFICLVYSIYSERDIWGYIFANRDNRCNISAKKLLKYAYPYIFSMGITLFFQAVDQISLNIFCSYEEVGIYASTMSLVHIFAIVQSAFNTVWAPASIEHFTKDKEDREFYIKGNQNITVVMFFIGITLILCKDMFSMLLGEKFREAAYILPLLIFNPIMYTISETTVSGLVFAKKSSKHIVIAIGACFVNIVGNVILVPRFGCRGAAISTGIAYIIFFSLRTFLANHYFYINFRLKRFYFLTFIVFIYAMYNTFFQFDIISIGGYIACLTVLLILYKETVLWGIKNIFGLILQIRNRHIR